jgi:hypothetical protein
VFLRRNKRKEKTSKGRRKEITDACVVHSCDVINGTKPQKEGRKKEHGRLSLLPSTSGTEGGKKLRARKEERKIVQYYPSISGGSPSCPLSSRSSLGLLLHTMVVPTIAHRPTSSHNHDAGLIQEACDDLAMTVPRFVSFTPQSRGEESAPLRTRYDILLDLS